jgi:trichohyalin
MDYFDYSEDFLESGEAFDLDIKSFLEESQELEQQRLEEELERIDQQLHQREEIYNEATRELESKLEWYIERLQDINKRCFSSNKEEKEHLKKKIEAFYSELRQERKNAWRDKQELEKERRELLRDLEEIDAQDIVEEILGDSNSPFER